MTIQKISQNLKNGKLRIFITTYHSSLSVLMIDNIHSSARKHHEGGKLRIFITTYHSSSSVLMIDNIHSSARKHYEGTKPGTRKTGQMFFFLLSSDGLSQHCVNLSRWFTHETAFVHRSAQLHRFFTASKSCDALVTTDSKTIACSWGRHFHGYLYACTLKDHLATKRNYYSKSLN